jgi:hypothetical protein
LQVTDDVMRSVDDTDARGAEIPPARTRKAPRAALLAIAGLCLLMAGISAADSHLVANVHGDSLHWGSILSATSPRWILFAVLLPLVLVLTLRRPPWPLSSGRTLLHLVVFLALTVVHAIVHTWSTSLVQPFGFMFGFELHATRVWINSMPLLIPLYCAVLLAAWSIEQTREQRERTLRTSQLEAQLHAARLAALRSQLHPHFLYNALNGISALSCCTRRFATTVAS